MHYESIAWHDAALQKIRSDYPNHEIVFGGDLNQSRDKPATKRYQYGTKRGRQLLTDMLEQNDLRCVTDCDFVASGDLTCRSSIDHVCISAGLEGKISNIGAWDAPELDDDPISDHNGVYVELTL